MSPEPVGFTPHPDLKIGPDYTITPGFIYTTRQPISMRRLTESGHSKLENYRKLIFENPHAARLTVPLNDTDKSSIDTSTLPPGTIVTMNELLALSIIRRLNGGYICSLTDNMESLRKKSVRAAVQQVTQNKVDLLFENWPGEYLKYAYTTPNLKDKPVNLEVIKQPVTIGPSATADFDSLLTGKPNESLIGWVRNLVIRNL